MMENAQLNRVEIAIDKLTIISSNLDKLLGVHELKLTTHEKQLDQLDNAFEKRREYVDASFTNVYDKMRAEDKSVLEEVNSLKALFEKNTEKVTARVQKVERNMFMYMGGLSVIVFILTYGQSFLHMFSAVAAAK